MSSERTQPTAIDLFCGCGGISEGLRRAGFRILAGADVEKKYIQSFVRNFPEAKHLKIDLASWSPERLAERLALKPGDLDLLVGGPPCQGFSKNVPRSRRRLDDPKNQQVSTFLSYCEWFRPNLVLMENVAEMRRGFDEVYTTEVNERLSALGYSVDHRVLLSADYGVPQRRRRAFFLAARSAKAPVFPHPTHVGSSNEPDLFAKSHVTVWEAIGDLPPLKHGEGDDPCEYAAAPFSDYQRTVRNGQKVVANHVARKLQPKQYARLASLQPGQGLKDLPTELQTKGGYSGAYGRLTEEMVAPTITRWVFHPGSGRFGHPRDIRVVTIREAARLQGFPDSFEFEGTYLQQAGQVGNAVPPLVSEAIGRTLRDQYGC